MVRFKGTPLPSRPLAGYRFHPTMVRFKEGRRRLCHCPAQVSIPLWCDLKGPGRGPDLRGPVPVSIPLWCDLKKSPLLNAALAYAVSIPLWCDLKRGGAPRRRSAAAPFPSHYGAI